MTNTTGRTADMWKFGLSLFGGLAPVAALAASIDVPANASLTRTIAKPNADFSLATGPFTINTQPSLSVSGPFSQQAWRVDAPGLTTLQILVPLKLQLLNASYDILFECDTETCGGFDFRFAQDVIAEPDMHVDLGQFRYLAAQKDGQSISLLISTSAQAGYIQITSVGATALTDAVTPDAGTPLKAERPVSDLPIGRSLESLGFTELSDLAFETGSSNLAASDFASLAALAEYLLQNPDRKIALVGHSDSEGSLDGNIALSKRRAASVLERLVTQFEVPRTQMDAQGMGYLSPVDTNLTPEGREANRRVEVIVTSTQ
jgi:OOP family OmpA-OmpF porin